MFIQNHIAMKQVSIILSLLLLNITSFGQEINTKLLFSESYTKAYQIKVDNLNGNDSIAIKKHLLSDTSAKFKTLTAAIIFANSVISNAISISLSESSQSNPIDLNFCGIRNRNITIRSATTNVQWVRCTDISLWMNCRIYTHRVAFICAPENTFSMFNLGYQSNFFMDDAGSGTTGGFYFTANNQSIFAPDEQNNSVFIENNVVFDTQSFTGISFIKTSLQSGHPLHVELDPNANLPSNLNINGVRLYRGGNSLHLGYSYFNQINTQNLLNVNGTGSFNKIGVGISTPQAILDVNSTSNFVILCPMTQTQRNSLTGLVAGAEIYCTDCTATDGSVGVKQVFNGTIWKNCW